MPDTRRAFRPVLSAAVGLLLGLCITPANAQHSTHEENKSARPWRDALERVERKLDNALDRLTGADRTLSPQAGLFVPADASPEAAAAHPMKWRPLTDAETVPGRAVLLVHGLDEAGDIWSELAPALVESGHAVIRFEYPNDQRIDASTSLLLEHLRAAKAEGLDEVAVVAHSMGGLVSFNALTRDDGYAGEVTDPADLPSVTRFVAVGTPWNGSGWARLQAMGEVHEQVSRLLAESSLDLRTLLQYRRDGSGQAGDDLLPGSVFLTEIQDRPWPAGLPLTVIAGKITNPDPATYDSLGESAILRELLGPAELEHFVASLREATEDLGDGVVSLQSASGRATDDFQVYPVNHRALLRASPIDFLTGTIPDGPPAIPVILDRLANDQARASMPED